ncbi:hypothetical protein K443DRAFT_91468, partial [Laccaria amethystina LaAM-08-1]
VQSGFLRPKHATVDRNRSRTDPDIGGTGQDHLGPVFCGPRNKKRPVQTGFLAAYNLFQDFRPFLRFFSTS